MKPLSALDPAEYKIATVYHWRRKMRLKEITSEVLANKGCLNPRTERENPVEYSLATPRTPTHLVPSARQRQSNAKGSEMLKEH